MVVALLVLAAGAARAQSQAANGTIEGTIKDASGGLLPGVTVTVHNTDTGAERVVVPSFSISTATSASQVSRSSSMLPVRTTAKIVTFGTLP